MRRFIIAPDSFKGTMTAAEICDILGRVVEAFAPGAEIVKIPMSDGGEGMVEAYHRLLGGEKLYHCVSGPKGELLDCPYALLPNGYAVMEMAGCAGLPLMKGQLDPMHATTFGVGQMLRFFERQGYTQVLMGIGGSATNDCGVGMAAALGYKFLDSSGAELEPFACNIGKIRRIVKPERELRLNITVACDVNNPLCGERGASAVFGPQKGLKPNEIPVLDADIRAFAELIGQTLGVDVLDVPGAGAAGGLGAALMSFCGARLMPGIELLLDTAGIDALLEETELVITGEGRMDHQSASGKVPDGVGRRAKMAGVPCVAICGCIGEGAQAMLQRGISAYYPCSDGGRTMEELLKSCRTDLENTARLSLREWIK